MSLTRQEQISCEMFPFSPGSKNRCFVTVKVWDLETGEALATFTCDSEAVCCSYSDILKLIVVGDAGGHVHLLRLEEPKRKN